MVHEHSIKLLENMCQTIAIIKDANILKDGLVFEALSEAVDEGNVKFIEELMKANSVFAASSTDQQYSREIYVHVIQSRQVELVEHILKKVPKSRYVLEISAMADKYGNNLLHEAARLPPSLSIREAALQMQKELRWFEVNVCVCACFYIYVYVYEYIGVCIYILFVYRVFPKFNI